MSVTFYGLKITNEGLSDIGEAIKDIIHAPIGLVKTIKEINDSDDMTEVGDIAEACCKIGVKVVLTIPHIIIGSRYITKKYGPLIIKQVKKNWKKAAIIGGLYGLGELVLHTTCAHYKPDQYLDCPYKEKNLAERQEEP
jgi:hypothetical protein